MKKKKENYLDYIPICSPQHAFQVDEKGLVEIKVTNKGFYNWLAQKCFKRPRVSMISLDEYGSYVWQQIDGKRTIYEIALLVKERYGKEAEPLMERITKYFKILYMNHFIGYVI